MTLKKYMKNQLSELLLEKEDNERKILSLQEELVHKQNKRLEQQELIHEICETHGLKISDQGEGYKAVGVITQRYLVEGI